MLEAEGFLDVTASRGCFVATLSADKADDLFEVRLAMEPLGARLAARDAGNPRNASGARIARMKEILADVETNPRRAESRHAVPGCTPTALPHLRDDRQQLPDRDRDPMVKRGQWLLRQERAAAHPRCLVTHHELIAAIEAGDPDLAEAVARHHVLSVRGEMRELLRRELASSPAAALDMRAAGRQAAEHARQPPSLYTRLRHHHLDSHPRPAPPKLTAPGPPSASFAG